MSQLSSADPAQGAAPAFRYEAQDFVDAHRLHVRIRMRRKGWIAVAVLLLAWLFGVCVMIRDKPSWAVVCVSGALGAAAVYAAAFYLFIPYFTRRNFKRYPLAQTEQAFELKRDGVRFISSHGDMTIFWSDLIGWRANAKVVIVYASPHLYYVFPRRCTSPSFSIDALKATLASNVPER
jgi:hypothetical protein